MFKHRKFGEWVFVESFYKVREDEFAKWIADKSLQEKISEFMQTKKDFIESSKELSSNTQFRAFSTDSLLLYELKHNKDICMASLDEMIDIIKQGLKNNNFRGVSASSNYVLLFAKITEWAYKNRLRNDYYNKADFNINEEDYIDTEDVYTPNEMADIFRHIEKEDVYICMMASLEGLTNREVLNIKRKSFKTREENTPINVGDREFKLSDNLYHAMYDYAQAVFIEKQIGGRTPFQAELNDSEMLIRTIKTSVSNNTVTQTALCINIKKQMSKLGYENLTANKARAYSMYYDLLKGMDIDNFNIKYGTKFQHAKIVMKSNEIIAKMKQKIAEETV